MKKLNALFLLSIFVLVVFLSNPTHAADSYYKSTKMPSQDILLKNLKVLQGPSSMGIGRQGTVQFILGSHHDSYNSRYLLYYCYASPRKGAILDNKGNEGCYRDVVVFKLDSDLWIMQSSLSQDWLIIEK
jgi:hypothetical protein